MNINFESTLAFVHSSSELALEALADKCKQQLAKLGLRDSEFDPHVPKPTDADQIAGFTYSQSNVFRWIDSVRLPVELPPGTNPRSRRAREEAHAVDNVTRLGVLTATVNARLKRLEEARNPGPEVEGEQIEKIATPPELPPAPESNTEQPGVPDPPTPEPPAPVDPSTGEQPPELIVVEEGEGGGDTQQ